MSKKDVSRTPPLKLKMSATKKKMAVRTAKLKSSSWYEGATRSIAINKGKPRENRNDVVE